MNNNFVNSFDDDYEIESAYEHEADKIANVMSDEEIIRENNLTIQQNCRVIDILIDENVKLIDEIWSISDGK